jgi:hypothetical protein
MELFSKGQLHSGKSGKVVTDPDQAKAIALSACGESRYAEVLSSLGFSEETASLVVEMFAEVFLKKAKSSVSSSSFQELNWAKSFETGKGPGPKRKDNYKTGKREGVSPTDARIGKTGVKGDMGKQKVNTESEMLSGPALEKGPVNPQSGSSKEVFGLRALG